MGCWKTNAKSQFDHWSGSYDQSVLQRLFFRPSHEKLLSVAHIPAKARILDVGCGTGQFAFRLLAANPAATLVGLDLSECMLAQAATNCARCADRLTLVHGDSEHMPFADGTFDVITCIHSFHHYPHQAAVLREMRRVLKPGGELLILDADRDGWWGWFVYDWVVKSIEGLVHHCSARQFRELFRGAGFAEIRQIRAGGVAPFLITRGMAAQSVLRREAA